MQLSPIVLFVYNRLWHTQQTLEALKKNVLSRDSDLFIFSDAPKDKGAEDGVKKIREYIKTIQGFKSITIVESSKNLGLSKSIISGVTKVVTQYGRIIVLEDDMVTSPYFIKFVNDSLSLYEHEEKVISICGYMFPVNIKGKQTTFFRLPHCWGWATWKRGWDLFDSNGNRLLENLKAKKLLRNFDLCGAYGYTDMLKKQIRGRNDSWAIRWYASSFLDGKLSLYPYRSLVKNIGMDYSGIHCQNINGFDTGLLMKPVLVEKIQIAENKSTLRAIKVFFWLKRLNILRILTNKTPKVF